jgi:pimeloyl-ACP methyl ester carboxylesterase
MLFPSSGRIDAGTAKRKAIAFAGGDLESLDRDVKARGEEGAGRRISFAVLSAMRTVRNMGRRGDRDVGPRAVEVWGVNYPGFGGSTGPARLARIGPAALAAFDALKREARDRPVVVFGASMGTTAALHIAAHRRLLV